MPRRNIVHVTLPSAKPDRCVDCPLLGVVPKYVQRKAGSHENFVCMGTMEAIRTRQSKVRASSRDSHHPLHRPCDDRWEMWMTLAGRRLGISTEVFRECRLPYEAALEFQIKFHY